MTSPVTSVIELFLRSTSVDVAPADFETLGHACAGPGAQMRAAAATRGLRAFLGDQREALDRVAALAEVLHEELVVWDVATLRGRHMARRKGIRRTPAVLVGAGPPESVSEFARAAAAIRPAVGRPRG